MLHSDDIYEGIARPHTRQDYALALTSAANKGGQGWVNAWMRERDRLVNELIDARGDLDTALGVLRVAMRRDEAVGEDFHVTDAELRMNRALQALNETLGSLGSPMA